MLISEYSDVLTTRMCKKKYNICTSVLVRFWGLDNNFAGYRIQVIKVIRGEAGVKSNKLAKFLVAVVMTAGIIWSSVAVAIDWNMTGFVRQEIGISISGQENQNNQKSIVDTN